MKITPTDYEMINEILEVNKPDVAPSTRKTYASILRTLHKKMYGLSSEITHNCFSNEDDIVDNLTDVEPKKRKTILSAVLAFNGDDFPSNKLRQLLMDDSTHSKKENSKQVKNDKQKQNWIDMDEVKKVFEKKYALVKPIMKMKELTKAHYFLWTELIILALTTGIFFPPRRSTDWVMLKIRNYDPDTDNWVDMKRKEFVINQYKTSKFYNTIKIPIPAKLWTILKPYIALNTDSDWLLTNKGGEKITAPRLTQILNKLFDKSISTSMLRHIYLTDKLGNIPKLNLLQELADEMGHNILQQQEYILHDA